MKNIYDKIVEYDSIIIQRHRAPDLDALGSQFGLYKSLKKTFPSKSIHVVGDITEKYLFMGEMETLTDEEFKKSLVIVLDSGSRELISDSRYEIADFFIKIDHHVNRDPYGDICCVKEDYSSTCEIIVEFIKDFDLVMDQDIATTLYYGMVTDSGRFLYNSISQRTFELAAYLFSFGLDVDSIYPNIYTQSEETVRLRGYFMQNFIREGNVAFLKHTYDELVAFDFDFFTMSRGMVNVMSGVEGIDIWCNFTEKSKNEIICELRSSKHPIVEVATKYGGGGHVLACGCTLISWEQVDQLVADLKKY
jgi:phosphoesterase RecJ-like protein